MKPGCRESAQAHVEALKEQVVQAHSVATGLLARVTENEGSMEQLKEEKRQAEKAS